jgi:two-component system LytT family response regulator
MIRVVIADDEPLARGWLRELVEREPDFQVLGEACNGVQAVELCASEEPDVLFLDVEMPELDGLGALSAMGEDRPSCVVFVTAYDKFALRAFELHALDYLLKPFDGERFSRTIERVRKHLSVTPADRNGDALPRKLEALLATLQKPDKPDRLAVKDNGRVVFVRVEDIDWVEAYGNYVKLHTASGCHLLLQTMNGMEQRLGGERFLRIHRSTIVNIDRIQALEPMFHGEYEVKLAGGASLTLSRGYRDRLQSLIERFS